MTIKELTKKMKDFFDNMTQEDIDNLRADFEKQSKHDDGITLSEFLEMQKKTEGMKEIKPFTADDYFQQRFGKPDADFFEDWTSKNIIEFAEAYHREQVKQGVTEENLTIYNEGLNEGVGVERNRILEIFWETSYYNEELEVWICDQLKLTQKIKGE